MRDPQAPTSSGIYRVRITIEDCGGSASDIDDDCEITVIDLLEVILAWGPNADHPADVDGNGVVDVTDLVTVILEWGPVVEDYVLEVLSRSD